MRGRHSLAMLKMMGVEETIAANKDEYVKIAIRLGRDSQYRQYISQKVAENKYKLYRDLRPIRALENFLLNLVTKANFSADCTNDNSPLSADLHSKKHLKTNHTHDY